MIPVDDKIDKEVTEVFRSKEMITKKERGAKTAAETRLLSEEGRRRDTHRGEVRRLLEQAALSSVVYFRGNDRSPDENDITVVKAAESIMAKTLPDVFDRFSDGAARVAKKDLTACWRVRTCGDFPPCSRLSSCFATKAGRWLSKPTPVRCGNAHLDQQQERLRHQSTGQSTGRRVRQLSLRLGRRCRQALHAVSVASRPNHGDQPGAVNRIAVDFGASDVFTNNTKFRSATFRPKKVLDFAEIVKAADAFKSTFGEEIKELNQDEVAQAIREQGNQSATRFA